MKNAYTAPKLTSFGNVAEMTQVVGGNQRTDFLFNSAGQIISQGNDLGSRDAVGSAI